MQFDGALVDQARQIGLSILHRFGSTAAKAQGKKMPPFISSTQTLSLRECGQLPKGEPTHSRQVASCYRDFSVAVAPSGIDLFFFKVAGIQDGTVSFIQSELFRDNLLVRNYWIEQEWLNQKLLRCRQRLSPNTITKCHKWGRFPGLTPLTSGGRSDFDGGSAAVCPGLPRGTFIGATLIILQFVNGKIEVQLSAVGHVDV
ncbi:Protein of unknown function [Gryllus bimaculatus]|nr:Protein of unknown function [Gryllus bimaculatus]